MGQNLTMGVRQQLHPEKVPRTDRPVTFDPQAGFPRHRKKREMVATWDEMEKNHLSVTERDYCAHKYILLKQCRNSKYPLHLWYCTDFKHDWLACEFDDHVIRMMEFERERRLLERRQRKKERAAAAQN